MGLFDFITGGDKPGQDYLQQALQQFQNLKSPSAQEMQVNNLPLESVQGTINPEELQAITQDPNQIQGVSLNPQGLGAEESALGQFQNIANTGGLDSIAKLGIQQAAEAANRNLAGNIGAIEQNAQAQGIGNSGAALAEKLAAAQGSANNLQNQDLQAAAEAQANRQAAISGMANVGANVTGQGLQAGQFNANNVNQVLAQNNALKNIAAQTNVANNMQAQNTNLQNAQNINAANTGARQNQTYYNAQLPQQVYQNQLARAGGMSGVAGQQAGLAAQNAANNANMFGSLIGSAGKIGAAALASKGGVVKPLHLEEFVRPRKIGLIPGKEVVKGDNKRNDIVPANLSAGEVVIPKEVPKDTKHIKEFMRNAPIAGTNKKVNLEDFFKSKRG